MKSRDDPTLRSAASQSVEIADEPLLPDFHVEAASRHLDDAQRQREVAEIHDGFSFPQFLGLAIVIPIEHKGHSGKIQAARPQTLRLRGTLSTSQNGLDPAETGPHNDLDHVVGARSRARFPS